MKKRNYFIYNNNMKIRIPDGYKVPCDDCVIHFYDEDILVSERITDLDYPTVPLEEWLNMPFNKAQLFFVRPEDPMPLLHCWIKCPLCNTHWNVWDLRFFRVIKEWTEDDNSKTIRELIKDKHLGMSKGRLKTEEYGVEQLWGPEVAPPISEEIKKTIFDR